MRFASLLTNSAILLVLQQIISLWFLADFFLARDSSTANRLLNTHLLTKSTSKVLQQLEALNRDLSLSTCDQKLRQVPTFDKIVLVVIDALGADFLSLINDGNPTDKHKMPFIEQAIQEDKAMAFVAKAATPTVTMPRIKALISGTIPSYMDIVYNLANNVSDFHDDNLLRIARSRNKSILFYGDDTWLSLFDETTFKRFRTTLSLFGSDYTSVDTNVTEMVLAETKLDKLDWDYLLMHYLGLDHIGHVFGSNAGPLVDKKLIEMDDVLKEIYTDLSKKSHRTLIIICGDHGMSREGNHGGDTELESKTAMIFLPINMQLSGRKESIRNHIYQVDLAATLSSLVGLPIPSDSRGVVIERLLESLWSDDEAKSACSIIENLMQLVKLLDDAELDSPDGFGSQLLELLKQSTSSAKGSTFNRLKTRQYYELARDIQASLLTTIAAKSNPLSIMAAIAMVMVLSFRNLYRSSVRLLLPLMAPLEKLLCVTAVLLPILCQASTNFIEFENGFWVIFSIFILASCFRISFILHRKQSITGDLQIFRIIVLVVSLIITAIWNNTSLLKSLNIGWFLPAISITIMCNHSRSTSELDRKRSFIIFYTIGLCVFFTKMFEETSQKGENHIDQISFLQLLSFLFVCLASAVNVIMASSSDNLQPASIVQKLAIAWMWLIFLLSRSRNYPFLIANVMLEASLNSVSSALKLSPITRTLTYLSLSSMAFYGQGNSNLFSTLDVKPAFFAQTSYRSWLAVPLVACATYGGQIFWYLKLFQRVQGEKEQERMAESATYRRTGPLAAATEPSPSLIPEGTKDAIKDFIDMRNFLTLGFYMFVCIVLRNHLFIWSVISPKLVYLYVTNTILRITTATISVLPELLIRLISRLNRKHSLNRYKRVSNQ